MIERLGHQGANESRDQNGLTSEGFRELGPSEQPTAEKHPARVAGRSLEGRAMNEQYRPLAVTGTQSLTATEDRVSMDEATAAR